MSDEVADRIEELTNAVEDHGEKLEALVDAIKAKGDPVVNVTVPEIKVPKVVMPKPVAANVTVQERDSDGNIKSIRWEPESP